MRTDHSKKEEGVITMYYNGGLFILGKLIGGNKLADPRIFQIIPDLDEMGNQKVDKAGKPMPPLMQLSPPPGTPPFIIISSDGFHYPLPVTSDNQRLLALYERVTHPQPTSNIIVPPSGIISGQGKENVVKLN